MIYLDYAANTPVEKDVLKTFVDATIKYTANPNSSHQEGLKAFKAIDNASLNIAKLLDCDKDGIIYTSGASESNNLIIKGIADRSKNIGRHIIISPLEHSSIIAPCNYLASNGYVIDVLPLKKNGQVDIDALKDMIRDDTILVSVCYVDSELGTIQPIDEIGEFLKDYPNCIFHTDATQAIGKINCNFNNVDFVTFAPHKFYGLNGFGVLLNLNDKKLTPLIHGGKSTTIYRSGTPVTANVLALDKALDLAINNLDKRYHYILELNKFLRNELSVFSCVKINSPKYSIPNTLNISLKGIDAKKIVRTLEKEEIYLSTTSACSLGNSPSKSVFAITNDLELAKNSIRISLSHMTTMDEIKIFIEKFKDIYDKELNNENN